MPTGSLVDDLALRLARAVLGLTQRQASDRFGVTENTYRRWELDGMRPDPARRAELRAFVSQAIARLEGRTPDEVTPAPVEPVALAAAAG